jgi:hypothetical protein
VCHIIAVKIYTGDVAACVDADAEGSLQDAGA